MFGFSEDQLDICGRIRCDWFLKISNDKYKKYLNKWFEHPACPIVQSIKKSISDFYIHCPLSWSIYRATGIYFFRISPRCVRSELTEENYEKLLLRQEIKFYNMNGYKINVSSKILDIILFQDEWNIVDIYDRIMNNLIEITINVQNQIANVIFTEDEKKITYNEKSIKQFIENKKDIDSIIKKTYNLNLTIPSQGFLGSWKHNYVINNSRDIEFLFEKDFRHESEC